MLNYVEQGKGDASQAAGIIKERGRERKRAQVGEKEGKGNRQDPFFFVFASGCRRFLEWVEDVAYNFPGDACWGWIIEGNV